MIFRLDLGHITFDPVENAFATQQLAFLATSIAFSVVHCDPGKRRNQNFGFSIFGFFFGLFFFAISPFLLFLLQ